MIVHQFILEMSVSTAVSKNSFLLSSELPDVFTTSDSRRSKSCPSVLSQKISKHEKLFRDFHP